MKRVGVAILGFGTVGSGTYRILTEHREFYKETQDVDLSVESVLDTDKELMVEAGVPKDLIATNIAEVVLNPDVSVVVECIGGIGAAREYVLAALNAGKTVITSNKELFCKYSHELERAAKRMNAGLYFEASCVGGVPIIRTLLDGLQANKINSIMGIINGATNGVLTKMTEDDVSYEEALSAVQSEGNAEANPTADVEGFDSAYKLSILSSIAFHTKVPFSKVFREGITGVTTADVADGKALGYCLKLLAIGKQSESGIEVRVHPTFVKNEHPLANVQNNYNAVFVNGDAVGEIMLYGKGAGALPTGSAIVSDIIYAATHSENRYSTFKNTANADKDVKFISDFRSAYYLRLNLSDKSGVLSKICAILGKFNISIEKMVQRASGEEGKAILVLVTHETRELAIRNAVSQINALGFSQVQSVLRVVS